jgi:hypothetical protein
MARLKWIGLLSLVLVAGCATNHPTSPSVQGWPAGVHAESPQYIGRDCTARLRPDGIPDFTTGCTANDRLSFEQRFIP